MRSRDQRIDDALVSVERASPGVWFLADDGTIRTLDPISALAGDSSGSIIFSPGLAAGPSSKGDTLPAHKTTSVAFEALANASVITAAKDLALEVKRLRALLATPKPDIDASQDSPTLSIGNAKLVHLIKNVDETGYDVRSYLRNDDYGVLHLQLDEREKKKE